MTVDIRISIVYKIYVYCFLSQVDTHHKDGKDCLCQINDHIDYVHRALLLSSSKDILYGAGPVIEINLLKL